MAKTYVLKIDETTRKLLELKQTKMSQVIKRITGKEKKPPFTRLIKILSQNPIYLDDRELIKLSSKKRKL